MMAASKQGTGMGYRPVRYRGSSLKWSILVSPLVAGWLVAAVLYSCTLHTRHSVQGYSSDKYRTRRGGSFFLGKCATSAHDRDCTMSMMMQHCPGIFILRIPTEKSSDHLESKSSDSLGAVVTGNSHCSSALPMCIEDEDRLRFSFTGVRIQSSAESQQC